MIRSTLSATLVSSWKYPQGAVRDDTEIVGRSVIITGTSSSARAAPTKLTTRPAESRNAAIRAACMNLLSRKL
jgi:hypothetical protein